MKHKRIIAREVLIFFSGAAVVLILWGIIALRNTYYHHRIAIAEIVIKKAHDQDIANLKGKKLIPITNPALLKELDEGEEIKDPQQVKLETYSSRLIYDDELREILLIVSLIIVGIIYALRFVLILITWAIRTIKQPAQ